MTKTITCPVERWAGEIILHDPLTLPMVAAWEEASIEARSKKSLTAKHVAYWPGLSACVKEWHLKDFPERPTMESWPTKPYEDRHAMIVWLIGEINALYNDATTIPNE